MYTEHGMGNGIIDDLTDIIYMDPERFDKTRTQEMQAEIETLNEKMHRENKRYILIDQVAVGSRDRFLGIPVRWPQINRAKVILETGLRDFHCGGITGNAFSSTICGYECRLFHHPYVSQPILWIGSGY
jgi:hypothetical protein